MRWTLASALAVSCGLALGLVAGARSLADRPAGEAPRRTARVEASRHQPPPPRASRTAPAPARPAVAPGAPQVASSPDADASRPLAVTEWTDRFASHVEAGNWRTLAAELQRLEAGAAEAYRAADLGYLHARAALHAGRHEEGAARLAPYLAADHPFRPLALHHAATVASASGRTDEAAALRRELLLAHPGSPYWSQTFESHLEWLRGPAGPVQALTAVAELAPRVPQGRPRRELAAVRVAALSASGDRDAARSEGRALLADSTLDDAADRVAAILEQPELLNGLDVEGVVLVAETLRQHRRFPRAVELYERAQPSLPRARRVEVQFAIGRAHYFAERFAPARDAYVRGAEIARESEDRARFFYHAGRSAQLAGDDEQAEKLLTRAIAVPGRHPSTASALVTRLRLRIARGDLRTAHKDLRLLRRFFSRHDALFEGSVAYAMGELAEGRPEDALDTLGRLPQERLGRQERAEVSYWRGRALAAGGQTEAALDAYLEALRAPAPTAFAHFALQRLAEPPLADAARQRAALLREQARALLASGDLTAARRNQTDALLLAGEGSDVDRQALAAIYRLQPDYRRVLELTPRPLPRFPLVAPAPAELLAAMGLLDEARAWVAASYPTDEPSAALARAIAYRRGGATRAAIGTAESLASALPQDYQPALLPPLLRELLYPRRYLPAIAAEAARHGADPRLVLAIMREESRFDPRAKSPAAARGLLQLVPSTADEVARELGRTPPEPSELYEPRVAISLGAKYVGDLQARLSGDLHATAAAYNAGPLQAQVWQRLAPAPGADYFVSTVGFAETKGYVRKVLDSYARYADIYDPGSGASLAMRAAP